MKCILCGLALLLATLGLAQQPGQLPSPQSTPPTFPEEHAPAQQMPPDQEAPPPEKMSTTRVQQQIAQRFREEPSLTGTNVGVNTDAETIVLTGTVDTRGQHDLALRIARSYSGDRQVVDKIKVREHS